MNNLINEVAAFTNDELARLWWAVAQTMVARLWWILPLLAAGIMGAIEGWERRVRKHERREHVLRIIRNWPIGPNR